MSSELGRNADQPEERDVPAEPQRDVDVLFAEHDRGVIDRVAGSFDLAHRIDRELGASSPDLASVTKRIVSDHEHRLDLTAALRDPPRQDRTLEILSELSKGRLLGDDRTVADYGREHPGWGPLFEPGGPEINRLPDDRSRKDAFVGELKAVDPALARGLDGNRSILREHVRRLNDEVLPAVARETEALADSIAGSAWSARAKSSAAILDKMERMNRGGQGRPARPDYEVGDVIDAVGARITVEDTRSLETLVRRCQDHFGIGDGGRVLEVENLYATPKASNPSYRVVPMVVAIEVNGRPYTYELQLSTRRASIAADLEHNTIYKPYVQTTEAERRVVARCMHEAAALDQEETRSDRA